MTKKKYWIVEFRCPIQINIASSPMDAAQKAAKIVEKRFGFLPSAWFARVYEFDETSAGPVNEWFSNPGGSKFSRIDQNIKHHEPIED